MNQGINGKFFINKYKYNKGKKSLELCFDELEARSHYINEFIPISSNLDQNYYFKVMTKDNNLEIHSTKCSSGWKQVL